MPLALPAVVSTSSGWVRGRITTAAGFAYDFSKVCASLDTTRGRTNALEQSVPAGTCTTVLNDTYSLFDPDNTQSPLYGYLDPRGAATVRFDHYAAATGSWWPLFTGFIDSLERTFTGGVYSETTMTCADQTSELSRHIPPTGTVLPAQLPGARISLLLSAASRSGFVWTSRSASAAMMLDTGQKMLGQMVTDGSTSSWDLASAAADAEGGLLFFDAAGTLRFQGQQSRLQLSVGWVFGNTDSGGYLATYGTSY